MCKALYPTIRNIEMSEAERDAAIACCAEGYSFPTNLDSDPPIGGLVPKMQADLFYEALATGMSPEGFNAALDAMDARRRA